MPETHAQCSHCHAWNRLTPDAPTFCVRCFHRADVSRLRCDCSACATGPGPLTSAAVRAAEEWLERITKERTR